MSKVRTALVLVLIVALASMTFMACNPGKPTLTTSSNPDSGGTINPGSGTYGKGVGVDIVATPASGYRFDHWEGRASGQSPTVHITMDGNKNVTAYFTKTYTLAVSSTPANGGTVSPNGGTYDEDKDVTLAATPAQYYKFNGWSGDTSGTSDHVTITMDSNKTVVASFTKLTYTLQTQVDASGGGTIDPTSGPFEAGNHVRISATPATGYRFHHWGASATGDSNPLNLLLDADKTVTAYFARVYTLSVSSDPIGSGSISPNGGIFDAGTVVTLTPVAVFPYALDHWSGTDNDAANPTTVTITADESATAHFRELTPGTQQSAHALLDSTAAIPVTLAAGQWLQGQITSSTPYPSAYMTDPNGTTVKDFGSVTTANFTLQAAISGTYYLNLTRTTFGGYPPTYTFTYTIYS